MAEMPLFLLSVNSQSQERTAETLVNPHHSLLSAEQSQGRGVPPAYCPRVLGIISIQRTSARVRPHPISRVEGAGSGCSIRVVVECVTATSWLEHGENVAGMCPGWGLA